MVGGAGPSLALVRLHRDGLVNLTITSLIHQHLGFVEQLPLQAVRRFRGGPETAGLVELHLPFEPLDVCT